MVNKIKSISPFSLTIFYLCTVEFTEVAAPFAATATEVNAVVTILLIEEAPSSALVSSISVCFVPDVFGLPE